MFLINTNKMSELKNYLEYLKNINYIDILKHTQDKIITGKHIYLHNKKSIDLALCVVCFFLIIVEWLDLSFISDLYFLGLIYMTVTTVGYYYNKKINLDSGDQKQINKIFENFSLLSNNWLIYSILIICDWILQTINVFIGNIVLGPIIQICRIMLYMQYCRQFIKSCEPYCQEMLEVDNIYISDELTKKIILPTNVKHLVNIIAINNIFFFNLLKVNLKFLILIDRCLSSGVDILSNLILKGLKQTSKAKSLSIVSVKNTKEYVVSIIQKMRSLVPGYSRPKGDIKKNE